jgi:hypothetical protein
MAGVLVASIKLEGEMLLHEAINEGCLRKPVGDRQPTISLRLAR